MKIINFLLVVLISSTTFSQNKLTKKQLDELPNTIENQFIKTYGKASSWQKYKMIPRTEFQAFQKSVLDSVNLLKKDISTKLSTIENQAKEISSLNEKINGLSGNLDTAIAKEDQINFIGIALSKKTYNVITWSVIALLLGSLLFFIFRFKNSNILTRKAKNNLAEIEQEFELHRKKSLEKEQKLRRQLQDEINKQRGV
ncbi:hypothetical protein [Tenacibaculum agarivorans]|uniref:hypothetical protein n=1 Tax=Tenacibaculum agarivorans TaxID=1908389 RepID=UPI00094B797F|nr:hypothetical protein [Tenacibaculum agarivorans]